MKSPKLSPIQEKVLLKMEPRKWSCLCGETADGKRWMPGIRQATVEALLREKLIRLILLQRGILAWFLCLVLGDGGNGYFKLTRKGLRVREAIQRQYREEADDRWPDTEEPDGDLS